MSCTRNRRNTVRAPYTSEENRLEKPHELIEARKSGVSGEISPTSVPKSEGLQRPKSSAKIKRPKVYKSVLLTPTLLPIPESPVLQPITQIPSAVTGIREGTQDIVLRLPLRCPICQLTFAKRQSLRQHIIFHVMVEGRRGVIEYR